MLADRRQETKRDVLLQTVNGGPFRSPRQFTSWPVGFLPNLGGLNSGLPMARRSNPLFWGPYEKWLAGFLGMKRAL